MKKIITWLASFILSTSTAPIISQLVLNTSFNKSNANNNYSYKNDSYWPIYNDLQHKGNFEKFNDSLGVFNDNEYQKTYFVNKDGQFTELKLNGNSITGTFSQFNDNQGVFITATASYFLSNSGTFTELKVKGIYDSPISITGTAKRMNENTCVYTSNQGWNFFR